MGQTSGLMKEINSCMNIKEMNQTMTELQKEMMQVLLNFRYFLTNSFKTSRKSLKSTA